MCVVDRVRLDVTTLVEIFELVDVFKASYTTVISALNCIFDPIATYQFFTWLRGGF
jgi:hypothetical protein